MYHFENIYDNEQYFGIDSEFDIFLPWDEINPEFNYVKKIDSNTIKFYHEEIPQFIKAFLLIFYNKVVKKSLPLRDMLNLDFIFLTNNNRNVYIYRISFKLLYFKI